MHCNGFGKHKVVQIHSNSLRKAFTQDVFQIISDTKLTQTFPVSKVPDSYSICDNFVSDSCSLV